MKAVFPGSFDPISNGHLAIIARASLLFEEVIVVVATNTHKATLFSPRKRFEMAKEAVSGWKNVHVELVQDELTVTLLQRLGTNVIVRGIRNEQDFIYEQQIAQMNNKLDPNVETVILFSSPETCCISSSLIREIARFGGDLSAVVPKNVNLALRALYQNK
ncbi:pantetheine-phosphate adenylyltransferase [Lactobacillus sp. XV13L]|nr:pantetheine-phosphate adenylyltransferase [Lactobacillus sp. XV13L]